MCNSPLLYAFFPQVGGGWGPPFQVGPFCPEGATAALQTALQIGSAFPGSVAGVSYALSAANQWVPLASFLLPKLPGVSLDQLSGEAFRVRKSETPQDSAKRRAILDIATRLPGEAGQSSPWRFFVFTFGAQCVTGGAVPSRLYPVSVRSFASYEEAKQTAGELVAQMGATLPRQVFEAFIYASDGKQWVYAGFSEYWNNPTLCDDGKPWRP